MVVRLTDAQLEQARAFVKAYLATLDPDRNLLLDRYEFVDAALKVVGVGSVGTRCFVVLLAGKADLDPLFLQVKEAQPSVLAPYVGRSLYCQPGQAGRGRPAHHAGGQRCVPGWARAGEFDTYVRQLRDMKGSVPLDDARPDGLTLYGRLCGAALAARSCPSWPARPPRRIPGKEHGLRRQPGRVRGCHTPTRTTGTTSPSWTPSDPVGSQLSRDVDRKHERFDRPVATANGRGSMRLNRQSR